MLFVWSILPELAQHSPAWLYQACLAIVAFLRLDIILVYHTNMLVTGGALLWYVFSPTLRPAPPCHVQPQLQS